MNKPRNVIAMTSFFNPFDYQSKVVNFRTFRQHLQLPLMVVQQTFPKGRNILSQDDADSMIQIAGGDVMFQKERLLNIGLQHLSDEIEFVFFLDCDVRFLDPAWFEETLEMLQTKPMVQPFAKVKRLGPGMKVLKNRQKWRDSISASIAKGEFNGETGYAWAFRRDALSGGLFDACIVGGGDHAMVGAAYGRFEKVESSLKMNAAQKAYYRSWAEPFHARIQGDVGTAAGDLYTFWHGDYRKRKYADRHEEFSIYGFDPATDVHRQPGQCLTWATDKTEMHGYVKGYFEGRAEDD